MDGLVSVFVRGRSPPIAAAGSLLLSCPKEVFSLSALPGAGTAILVYCPHA